MTFDCKLRLTALPLIRSSALFGQKVRASDSPPMPSCHALPRFHIFSAIPVGDHRVGIPTARLVVIPLFMGFLGRRFNMCNIRISFLSPAVQLVNSRTAHKSANSSRRTQIVLLT